MAARMRRAFRIAGAETVLASHWKVSDKATSQLMTEFMRRWRSGQPRAQAWRETEIVREGGSGSGAGSGAGGLTAGFVDVYDATTGTFSPRFECWIKDANG